MKELPAAILGDYTNLVFRKTRSVAVVEIEIPIELASDFVAKFGTPNQGKGIPVALARIQQDTPKAIERPKTVDELKERRKLSELPLSQQCAIRCAEPLFQEFLTERGLTAPNAEETAVTVRSLCFIPSRSKLDTDNDAADIWRQLDGDYLFWMRHREI